MRDSVYIGCMAIVIGTDFYPVPVVHVNGYNGLLWECVYAEGEYLVDFLIDGEYLSRITPEDEDTIERYQNSNEDKNYV